MANKEKFIQDVLKNGKVKSWKEYADMYNLRPNGDNKQKSDTARRIFKDYKRNPVRQKLNNEYEEFLKWKNSKETYKEKSKALPKPFLKGDKKNVIIIGDTHLPFEKEGYLEFCREQQEKYNCGTVVHIGDLIDNHAVSYHEHDPEGMSIGDEYKLALTKARQWYQVFPTVKVCIGNHDALPFRKAFTAGLPSTWLKNYQEMFESPKAWDWAFTHEIEGVIYQHGTGLSGEMASINCARENRQSTVIGHMHTVMNTRFLASFKDLIFGMNVGCGIDHTKYAFIYLLYHNQPSNDSFPFENR